MTRVLQYKIGAEEIPLRLAAADLASILQQRFGEAEPQRFAFADRGVLPCAAVRQERNMVPFWWFHCGDECPFSLPDRTTAHLLRW